MVRGSDQKNIFRASLPIRSQGHHRSLRFKDAIEKRGTTLRNAVQGEGNLMAKDPSFVSYNPSILTVQSEKDGQPHLIAKKCRACNILIFPAQPFCHQCLGDDLESIELSNQGEIYSFTIVERESLAPSDFQIPFAYGYIDLPEGVRVLAKIIDWQPESLKIGLPVKLTLERIRTDSDGHDVMVLRFAPDIGEKPE